MLARALNYIVYSVPPYRDRAVTDKGMIAAFQANIRCENPPATLSGGETVMLRFLIKNISQVEWPTLGNADGRGAVVLQSRWRTDNGEIVPGYDAEQAVPYDAEPGDTIGLTLQVPTPATPGDYLLEVDLVQKGVARFSERGSIPWTSRVIVTAKP
jgi:hypothetical protein